MMLRLPHLAPAAAALLSLFAFAPNVVAQDSKPASRPDESTPEKKDEKSEPDRHMVIRGGDVHIGNGSVLRRATVVLKNDKIEAVGHDVEIPEGATEIDASGKVVSPGFVAVRAGGFGAPNSFGLDSIKDGLNPYDPQIKLGLAVGITSFGMLASGGRDTPKGKSAVIKLAPEDLEGMLCEEGSFVSMRVPLDRKQWKAFRENVEKAREYKKKLAEKKNAKPDATKKEEKKPEAKPSGRPTRRGRRGSSSSGSKDGTPKPPRGTETILKILDGETTLWIDFGNGGGGFFSFMRGPRQPDNGKVKQACEIAELLGTGVVMDRPVSAWALADEIARTGSSVVLVPRDRAEPDKGRPENTGSNLASARILDEAGVPVAVISPSTRLSNDGIMGQDLSTLHVDAAFAVRGGLDNRKALRTITLDAAKTLGVGSRIGSIEVGKDADVLILDGDPLHYRTLVDTAIVNGKIAYERHKEPYYSHIKR